jgi:hypothetical protein
LLHGGQRTDVDAIGRLFAPDAVTLPTPGRPPVRRREAILERYARQNAAMIRMHAGTARPFIVVNAAADYWRAEVTAGPGGLLQTEEINTREMIDPAAARRASLVTADHRIEPWLQSRRTSPERATVFPLHIASDVPPRFRYASSR